MKQSPPLYSEKAPPKAGRIIEKVVIGLLTLAIALSLAAFFLFPSENSMPKLFGYHLLISRMTTMNDIPEGAVVMASEKELTKAGPGAVVVCRLDDRDSPAILRIQDMQMENGEIFYVLKADKAADNETIRLPEKNIVAKAQYADPTWGKILTFVTSFKGMLILVVLPCVLLIGWEIFRIIQLRRTDGDLWEDEDSLEEDPDDAFYFAPSGQNPAAGRIPAQAAASRSQPVRNRQSAAGGPARPVIPLSPPLKKAYVGEEGRAEYHKSAPPNADSRELHEALRPAGPRVQPPKPAASRAGIYSPESVSRAAERPVTSSRLSAPGNPPEKGSRPSPAARVPSGETPSRTRMPSQKEPVFAASAPPRREHTIIKEEPASQIPAPRPQPARSPSSSIPPSVRASAPPRREPLEDDIMIPSAAAKPTKPIAPPPKKSSNKTVEELMKVIESGLQDNK